MQRILEYIASILLVTHEDVSHYFDRNTGQILSVEDPFDGDDSDDLVSALIEQNPERFVLLPGVHEIDEPGIQLAFARAQEDDAVREKLEAAAQHLYAKTMFPDTVDAAGLTDAWEKARDEALEGLAQRWADENGIELERR